MTNFEKTLMKRRPEWNRLGPPLPAWFTLALERLDRNLVMQYMPPRGTRGVSGGVDTAYFPHGVWIVGRQIPGTNWLFKRWVLALTDEWGRYRRPGTDVINLLRKARDLARHNRAHVLEHRVGRYLQSAARTTRAISRERLCLHVEELCRMYDWRVGNGVFMPKPSGIVAGEAV